MASTLSPSAVRQIVVLVHDAPADKQEKNNSIDSRASMLQYVNSNWNAVYKLCMHIEPAPPLHYFDSLEPALVFKDEVDDADARAIFACGRPLQFYGCPRLLVSKIVEAFTALKKEPACLDMTIFALYFVGVLRPSEAWSQVYTKHLPCYACTTVETVKGKTIPRDTSRSMPGSIGWHEAVDFAVEKFHVFSQCFRKRLTVELHRRLVRGTAENEREQSCVFHKIKIRLVDEICSPQGGRSGTPNRSSATPLLLPEFASDVLGYLDRAHVGSSLLSNRGLHNLICQLKQRLPVHHLKCAFEEEMVGPGCVVRFSGAYWLEIRHLQRDLPYTNVRFFKMPSTSGAADDCALIRHYLSNSHVDNLRAPTRVPEFPFAIKMLASLKGCNVTAGRVKLSAGAERLSDYRSMDAVFGELRMGKLSFTVAEHRFVQLVKTADFFRMSAIQTLQELKLTLTRARDGADGPRGRAESKSPLWVSGIYLLRSSLHYRVIYESDRHLRSIERKMVHICEAFERGEITDTVEHFEFSTSSSNGMKHAFKRDNLLVSGLKVEGRSQWDPIKNYEWNVYRFRNASTNEYLTACVGQSTSAFNAKSLLHISKGEVYPDASFAYY